MVGVDEIVSGQDIGALSQWPPPHQPKKLCSSPVNTAVNIAFSQALTRTHIYRSVSVLICSEIHSIPFVLCCYFISIFFYQQDKIYLLNNLDENDDLCDENGERMKKFSRFCCCCRFCHSDATDSRVIYSRQGNQSEKAEWDWHRTSFRTIKI